jgi:hypothetical protein
VSFPRPANLLLAALACGFTVGFVEVALRALWTVERVTLVHDPRLGFRGRGGAETLWTREMAGQPRTVRLNGEGFHDHERRPQPASGTRRVVFLGDSFLEAYQVDIDSSFSQRLGRRLSSPAAPVEAVNHGLHGYGLGVHAIYAREVLPEWHPEAVVLCLFLGNDLHDNFTPVASAAVPRFHLQAGRLAYLPAPAADVRTWLRDQVLARSTLVRFLWMRVIKTSAGAMAVARAAGMVSTPDMESDAAGQTEEMTAVGQRLLERIRDDLRARGVPLLVFVIPDPFRVHDLANARRAAEQGTPALRLEGEQGQVEAGVLAALTSLGLAHVYPREAFVQARVDGAGYYRNGFGHFTDEAHRVVADLLQPAVSRLLTAAGSD